MLVFYKHVLIVLFILICLICIYGNFFMCWLLFNPLPELNSNESPNYIISLGKSLTLKLIQAIIIVNILVIPLLIYLLKFLW